MGEKIADEVCLFICRLGFAMNVVCLAEATNELDVMSTIMHLLFMVMSYIGERVLLNHKK